MLTFILIGVQREDLEVLGWAELSGKLRKPVQHGIEAFDGPDMATARRIGWIRYSATRQKAVLERLRKGVVYA